jgi:hypothetical protein
MELSSPPAKRTLHLLLPPDISSANDNHRSNLAPVLIERISGGETYVHKGAIALIDIEIIGGGIVCDDNLKVISNRKMLGW